MRITVHAKPGARKESVTRESDGSYRVSVREPALNGKANRAIEAALAAHLKLPKRAVWIVAGHTAKTKIAAVQP